jgi:hypothetical protein
MAHDAQKNYCIYVSQLLPKYFSNKSVLDVGCLDVNGNNRYLFTNCDYTGLDIGEGPNVDIVMPAHEYAASTDIQFDVVISTEMLEHDCHRADSLKGIYNLAKSGGLILLTAATTGRFKHGTHDAFPDSSPFTLDYYENVTSEMLTEELVKYGFTDYKISVVDTDIQFWGIKR